MSCDGANWISRSAEETEALGEALGATAVAGGVLALFGSMGAGKTCLVRGLARGLGCPERVSSPTFTLEGLYRGRLELRHYDAYFAERAIDYLEQGAEEAFGGEGVCAVEWAENLPDHLPADRLELRIEHRGPEEREFFALARGPFSQAWWEATVGELRRQGLFPSTD